MDLKYGFGWIENFQSISIYFRLLGETAANCYEPRTLLFISDSFISMQKRIE